MDEIIQVDGVTGICDIIAVVQGESFREIGDVIRWKILATKGISQITVVPVMNI